MQHNNKNYFTRVHLPLFEPSAKANEFITGLKTDEIELLNLIELNTINDSKFNSSLTTELKHFLQFASTMAWAFPIGLLLRRILRKNKKLNHILQFNELLSVRNNIEKGSFAYDTLLFKLKPLQLVKNKSHIANLVCLAILFGDEFIDGIAEEYGKENIQQIFSDEKFNYYLQFKRQQGKYELLYEFDICDVLPPHVLSAVNAKYDITYKAFYNHLLFLLNEINQHLNKLDNTVINEAAQLICKACNRCFDTYIQDITAFNPNYSFADLLKYQKTKDDDIIQVLLTLRAVLLNKKMLNYQLQFTGWSSMVRSMQLYDDMQDIAHDCNFQMNTLAWFAKNYFVNEWLWLQSNKTRLVHLKGMELHATISLYMPASVILTMQYARNIAYTKLNWVQRKIQNYLWRKNWLGFNNPLLKEKPFCLSGLTKKNNCSIPFKIHFIRQHVDAIGHPMISTEMKTSLMFDIMLMDDELKKYIKQKISKKQKYFLTSCFLEFPISKKMALAKQFL